MKKNISNILNGVVGVALSACLWSCAAETPFEGDGYGTVYLRTVVNSIITRADGDVLQGSEVTDKTLREKYVVYITNPSGDLIYKNQGLDEIESEDYITLKAGKGYVAEAWTGIKNYASFSDRYYEADKCTFDVSKNNVTQVVLNAKIRNVVVSVCVDGIEDMSVLTDYSAVVSHSKGELSFTKETTGTRGYFMLPDDESSLNYAFTFTKADNTTFERSGEISNVEPGHHYILNLKYTTPTEDNFGVATFDIEIEDDGETYSDSQTLLSEPSISGIGFDISKSQIFAADSDIADDLYVMICANGKDGANGLTSVSISSESLQSLSSEVSFDMSEDSSLDNLGIEWLAPEYNATTNVSTAFIRFTKAFIRSLEGSHTIAINAKDAYSKSSSATLTISRSLSGDSELSE